MRSELDFIKINNEQVVRPPKFAPEKEDIYKGDYTTCTGRIIADRVGWKFADMDLEWGALPQNMIDILIGMDGVCELEFDDLDGNPCTENVMRMGVVAMRHRYTQGGVTIWKDVKVSIRFIGSHTED